MVLFPSKTRAFLCFQIIQAPRITSELNSFRRCFCSFFQDFLHQSTNELAVCLGAKRERFRGWRMLNQNCRANTHVVSRCWISSVSCTTTRPCQPRAPRMFDTQVRSCKSSLIVLDFLNLVSMHLKALGAKFSMLQPCNQRSVQNKVLCPLPTVLTIDTANEAAVLEWTGTSRPAQGRSGFVFSNQSQRICSAQPIISRL